MTTERIRLVSDMAAQAREIVPATPQDDGGGPPGGGDDPFLPEGCVVTTLGFAGLTYYFLDAAQQLIALPAEKISHSNILSLFGQHFEGLYKAYPRTNREGSIVGWRPELAKERLMASAKLKGVWDGAERERGPGAWRGDDGELVLHCGDRILVYPPPSSDPNRRPPAVSDYKPGLIGRYVYPAAERGPTPAAEPAIAGASGPGNAALEIFKTWPWKRGEIDGVLLLGWVGAAMIGGALHWRPLAWLTGGAGTGKSSLQQLLAYVFDDSLVKVSDASAAGIWQTLQKSTLPVVFDELEAEEDNRRNDNVVKLARQAASGGRILRGGVDHKSTEFTVRSCFLFSSILTPPLLGQDRSRLLILELGKFAPGAVPPAIEAARWRTIGAALRRRLVDGWPRFARTLEFYRASLAAVGHTARGADQFGTLLACADLLLHDGEPDGDSAEAWVRKLEAASMAEAEDLERDEDMALQRLLSSTLDVYRSGEKLTVAEWLRIAVNSEASDAGEAQRQLGKFGLRYVPADTPGGVRWLAIANYHQGLATIFAETHWKGRSGTMGVWVQAFRRLPGAERAQKAIYFAGAISKATLVPLELALPRREGG